MQALAQFFRAEFRPPDFLLAPVAGVDVSASGIKAVRVAEHTHGLELASFGEVPLPEGAIAGGEITDRDAVRKALVELARRQHFNRAYTGLPETRGYLFEATVPKGSEAEQRTAIEQHLEEYVPLPVPEVLFDFAPLADDEEGVHAVGVGYARRVVEDTLGAFTEAGIDVSAAESETYALPRALMAHGSDETVLIVDIGKSTTKLLVATGRLPRFVTTLELGGHALTLAIHKYFGATEEEARRIKNERGISSDAGNEEYLAAMLSTVSVIKDEVMRRLEYWQSRAGEEAHHAKVSRILLVGGNASVRGLATYLQDSLKIPTELGNVFQNFAPLDTWKSPLDPLEALAYGTAIGLALRDHER